MSKSPAVVRKWVPRDLRNSIRAYQPHYLNTRTYLTSSGVYIEPWRFDGGTTLGERTSVLLGLVCEPVRVFNFLKPVFQNATTDWPELVEVAAWTIRLDNPQHIALAKQVANELDGDTCSLFLQHDKCTSYRVENATNYHPLQQVLFS